MKKMLLKIFLILVSLGVNELHAQTTCAITATLRNQSYQPQAGMKLTVSRVTLNGVLISLGPVSYTSDALGLPRSASGDTIRLPRGAVACIETNVAGFNVPGGFCVTIPSQAVAALETLQPSGATPSTNAGFVAIMESDRAPTIFITGNNDTLVVTNGTLTALSATRVQLTTGGGGGGGSITLREVDGTPSIASATVFEVDQADGLVMTNPSGTIGRLDLSAVPLARLAAGTDAQMIVGDASGVWTARSISGDLVISNTGVAAVGDDSHGHTTSTVSSLDAGADFSAGQVALARGGTAADLSATGGTSQVLKQNSAGAAITVGQLAFSDLSGNATDAQIPNTITLDNLTQITTRAHSDLSGLTTGDPHTQYFLSGGRTSSQTAIGGTGAGEFLFLQSTANASRGQVVSLDQFHIRGASPIELEGATVDGFEFTIAATDPTADRIGTLPNVSGEFSLLGQDVDLSSAEASGTLAAARLGTFTGDVTTAGASYTTTIAADAVTYAELQNISATQRVLGRNTAGAGDAEEVTFTQFLDWVGSAAQGDLLYRNATGWTRLGAGTSGQVLHTQGAGANVIWDSDDGAGGGAPVDATYITQTANTTLTAEQALGALATGVMASTTTTGVVATRVLTGTTGAIAVTSGDGSANPTFTLSAAITVPTSYAIGSDPADADVIRLENNAKIAWEASPASADLTLGVDASEILQSSANFNAPVLNEGGNAVTNNAEALSGHLTGNLPSPSIASNVITPGMIANGDHGAFTYTANVAALDASSVSGGSGGIITDNTITADDIATGAIGADEIAGDALLWNEIGDAGADATVANAGFETDITSTIDAAGKSVLTITNTDADAAQVNSFLDLRHNDGADADVFYLRMIGDNDGTPTNDYLFNQSSFTSLLPVNVPAEAYNASGWDADTGAPQKDAVRDEIELKAPLASPTFTGTVTIPTPFTLGAVSVTPTGTELNFVDGVTSAIQTQLDGKQSSDADLTDLADGSLTGTKVGFADTDANFTATDVQSAIEELDDVINAGVPNSATAKVDWSELANVPAGFADGTDDGAGGGSSWSGLTAPTAATSFVSDATGETFTIDFQAAFTTGNQLEIKQTTGNPTGGSLGAFLAADANVSPIVKIENTAAVTIANGLQIAATNASGVLTNAINANDAEIVNALDIGANNIVTAATTLASTELDVLDGGIGMAELNTFSSADLAGRLTDESGTDVALFGTSPTITTPTISGAIALPDGVRQTFNPNGTTPGINFGSQAGDPSTPANGDVWYNSTTNKFRKHENAATSDMDTGGAGSPGGATTQIQFNDAGAFGGDADNVWDKTNNIQTLNGSVRLTAIAAPSAPTGSNIDINANTVAGKTLVAARFANDRISFIEDGLTKYINMFSLNQTTSIQSSGGQATLTGTVSHIFDTEARGGLMGNFATTSTAAASSGVTGINNFVRGSTAGANGFHFWGRFLFPDASYTSVRMFIGMSNQTVAIVTGSDNPAGHHAGFQYVQSRDGTTIQFMTKNGTTQSLASTSMTFAVAKIYDFWIYCPSQSSTIFWQINNLTDDTTQSGSVTANLPGASQIVGAVFGINNVTATIRNFRMRRSWARSDL